VGDPAGRMTQHEDPLVYYLDHNFAGKRIPALLREAGLEVRVHRDYYPPNCTDDVWLPAVAARGWVILTKDKKIRYRSNELAAVKVSGAKVFVLVAKQDLDAQGIVDAITSAAKAMARLCSKETAPFIAKIQSGGRVNRWWPEAGEAKT
jgi:hypothetical protein